MSSCLLRGACFVAINFILFKICSLRAEYSVVETNDLEERISNNVVLISTLDGKVTAIDPENNGKPMWCEETGPGPLLSSTISNIKITYDSQPIRLIPSLNGGLYRFDGEKLEPFPVTAEALLSASVKLTDQSIITGGNEIRTYGMNPKTGQVNYICEMSKCMRLNVDPENIDENVLLIKRHTQTVRAVDPMTGAEKWNFSVGRNEASIVSSSCSIPPSSKAIQDAEGSAANIPHTNCKPINVKDDKKDKNYIIKFVVPDGIMCAVHKDDPNNIIWKKKFDSPIVSAWETNGKEISNFELFDHDAIPKAGTSDKRQSFPKPFMYLGSFQKQMYIQESFPKPQETQTGFKGLPQSVYKEHFFKTPWKFYLATASHYGGSKLSKDDGRLLLSEKPKETALSVWHESCNIDFGYYLYADTSPSGNKCKPAAIKDNVTVSEGESIDQIVITSLWYWWKEVIAISLLTSVVIHFIITRHTLDKMKSKLSQESSHSNSQNDGADEDCSRDEVKPDESLQVAEKNVDFKPRYQTDFDHMRCLGRGGFGVVFEAKHKLDSCHYAIKRIGLQNRKESEESVKREVVALAKLDHPGVVRFYNAWIEELPSNWVDHNDEVLHESDIYTPSTFGTSKLISTNTDDKKFYKSDLLFPPNVNFSGSFNCDNLTFNHDTSSSFDITFERSKCDDEAKDPFKKYSSGIVCDAECSSSGTCSNNCNLENLKKDETESFEFESDSGCDKDQQVKNEVEENRPQSLALCDQNKKLYLYIQMQLCKENTLKGWLKDNSSSRDKMIILEIYDQILAAVQYVHEAKFMHRDLKPSNIFFSMDGRIKIGDFGLVTAMHDNQPHMMHTPLHDSVNSNQNHTDQVGTQLYMSPEQIARLPYDHKVDIFSLGLILFELLVPFTTVMERIKVMSNVKAQKFPGDFEIRSSKECDLLRKILSVKPVHRPEALEIKSYLYDMNPDLQPIVQRHVRSGSRTISSSSNE